MPLLRADTGCRCRNTLVSITTTRLRRSRGAGWRKMLFQTWELRMKSPTDIAVARRVRRVCDDAPNQRPTPGCVVADSTHPTNSHLDIRFRVVPLPQLFLELHAFVDDELAIVADADGPAFQGS